MRVPLGTTDQLSPSKCTIVPMSPTAQASLSAGAHVSADGATIDFDPGEGVTLLDWIALVKK